MLRLLDKPEFVDVWNESDLKLIECYEKNDVIGMKKLFENVIRRNLADKSVKDLIMMCRQKGVKNYSRLTRDEMVQALTEKE